MTKCTQCGYKIRGKEHANGEHHRKYAGTGNRKPRGKHASR